jgi:DNA-binding transcriptional LysR family regulator
MTYKQLQVFVSLIQENSFSGAAQQLNVTQPAISWQLKSLENELGISLMDRDTRGFTLTEAGRALYQNALTIVNQFDLLGDHMAHFQDVNTYRSRIASSSIPGEYLLPKLIQPFLAIYPDLLLKVEISNSTTVIDKVLKGEISLGIVDIYPKESELKAEQIASGLLIPVASPSLKIHEDITLEELMQTQLIISHVEGHRIHKLVQEFFDGEKIAYSNLKIAYESGSVQASITAALEGVGIAWVPKACVSSALQCGTLIQLTCTKPISLCYYLIHQTNRKLSPIEIALKSVLTGKSTKKIASLN